MSSVLSLVTDSLVLGAAVLALCVHTKANDSMFPTLPEASNNIGWQGNYFLVNGKPAILWSGSTHYARIPLERWRERLIEVTFGKLTTRADILVRCNYRPKSLSISAHCRGRHHLPGLCLHLWVGCPKL